MFWFHGLGETERHGHQVPELGSGRRVAGGGSASSEDPGWDGDCVHGHLVCS